MPAHEPPASHPSTHFIVDLDTLVQDLRLAVRYASRVGLLREKSMLDTLSAAEESLARSERPDVHALTLALNDVATSIAPMTLADLHFGRDPFLPRNERKSRLLQLSLTLFALIVLIVIGYFMHALHREQEALVTLTEIQELKPQQKLTAVRKMAQYEAPLVSPNTLYDEYHQRVSELSQINSRVFSSYTAALMASEIPLFPFGQYFSRPLSVGVEAPVPVGAAQAKAPADNPVAGMHVATSGTSAALAPVSGSEAAGPPNTISALPPSARDAMPDYRDAGGAPQAHGLCAEEQTGDLQLPEDSRNYPKWMQLALRDALNDFCFQLKVVSPGGEGALLSQSLNQLSFVDNIKEKVSLRVTWFLPFLYGLLGAAVFMMRNVASVRTPAVEWFPVVMRVSLGGVAGIVVGWFASANMLNGQATNVLSLPFALAFLTGYGIDAMFSLLDRLSRAIGDAPAKA